MELFICMIFGEKKNNKYYYVYSAFIFYFCFVLLSFNLREIVESYRRLPFFLSYLICFPFLFLVWVELHLLHAI